MSSVHKTSNISYPPFRRYGDRDRSLYVTLEQADRGHRSRLRRLAVVLLAAATLLLINGVVETRLI